MCRLDGLEEGMLHSTPKFKSWGLILLKINIFLNRLVKHFNPKNTIDHSLYNLIIFPSLYHKTYFY